MPAWTANVIRSLVSCLTRRVYDSHKVQVKFQVKMLITESTEREPGPSPRGYSGWASLGVKGPSLGDRIKHTRSHQLYSLVALKYVSVEGPTS